MKNTKKNGAKRNPVLVLAVLGLLVGAGATGAIATGLIPNLDTGVTGAVNAKVTNAPLLTLSNLDTGATTYGTESGSVAKFQENVAIDAPGFAQVSMTINVDRIADASTDAVLVRMTGLSDYVTVSLAVDPLTGNCTRIGNGEWVVKGIAGVDTAVDDAYDCTFTIYVSQYDSGTAGAVDNIWDFAISEISANQA